MKPVVKKITKDEPRFICDKRTFLSKEEARKALNKIRFDDSTWRKPQRSYECPKCSGWHLTSMPVQVYKEVIEIRDVKASVATEADSSTKADK